MDHPNIFSNFSLQTIFNQSTRLLTITLYTVTKRLELIARVDCDKANLCLI